MSSSPRKQIAALIFLAFAALFGPQAAHADAIPTIESGPNLFTNLLTTIESTISAISNPTTAVSTYATQVKGYVLDPLAHALAQAVLKQITASVVNSINGVNGSPQFVGSLALNLQQVGDTVGLSFISQFGSSNHSPFAPAISTAMRSNYLQQTSLAGFFSANQCTLSQSSPNINSFLAGNFKQGSWGSWFSLTTQQQNNPFTLYPVANGQLASVVGSAQTNQRQTIAQNNGFLSWCGPYAAPAIAVPVNNGVSATLNRGVPSIDANGNVTQTTQSVAINTTTGTTGGAAQPGPNCLNSDGTPGTTQTPGSIIESTLSKTLGAGVDSLVSVHDFNQAIDTILSALANKVVSTGLAELSGSPSSSSSTTGSTSTDPNAASVASQAVSLAQGSVSKLANYTSLWSTIQSSANTASSSVAQLAVSCPALANDTQTALLTEIQPVLNQAQAAFNTASTTQALALQVENDASTYTSAGAGAGGALAADTQALAAAPPSAQDIANAQTQASVTKAASSTSPYILTVSGGTAVDQMKLIAKNAANMLPFCGPPLLLQQI